MMYILTQEELDTLNNKNELAAITARQVLQDLCTRVANLEPVKSGWYEGKPWGCIHTVDYEWYCDDCPVQAVCPSRKSWSK
jgi:hypothetical protein